MCASPLPLDSRSVPYNTGWHLAHHVDIGIPYRNLPALHRELEAAGWVTPDARLSELSGTVAHAGEPPGLGSVIVIVIVVVDVVIAVGSSSWV